MNQEQMFAIKCAYADLKESLVEHLIDSRDSMLDWNAREQTIAGLETTFPELTQKSYTVEVCFGFKKRYQIDAPNQDEAFKRAEILGNLHKFNREEDIKVSAMYEVRNA